MTLFRSRLARRLVAWLVLCLLPVFAWAGWLTVTTVSSLEHMVRNTGRMAAKHNLEMLDRLVYDRYADVRVLVRLPAVQAMEVTRLPVVVDQFVTGYAPYYDLVLIADRDGRVRAVNRVDATGHPLSSAALIGRSVADEPWFRAAVERREPVIVEDVHEDQLVAQAYGEPHVVMSLSAPIQNEAGDLIGVLSARVGFKSLADSLVLAGHVYAPLDGNPVALVLMSRNGRELARTGEPGKGADQPGRRMRHESSQPRLAQVTSAGFADYPGIGWQMLADHPGGGVGPHMLVWGSAGLLGLLGVAGLVLLWGFDRQFLAPLHEVRYLVERLGRHEPVELDRLAVRDDDLGTLVRTVHQAAREVTEHRLRLEGLNAVSRCLQQAQVLEMTASRQEEFLRLVLNQAIELTGARYGAIGVFDETGDRLVQFLTVGLDEAARAAIGSLPASQGLLGHLAQKEGVVRLANLTAHPASGGFPPHHPPMRTFLGVSIRAQGRSFGAIYLTEKAEGEEFTDIDATVIQALAAQAGIAIEDGEHRRQLRASEAALRESESQFRAMAEASPVPMAISRETDGRILFANATLGDLFGLSATALIGRSSREFYQDPADRDQVLAILRRDGQVRDYEIRYRKPDGTSLLLACSIRRITLGAESVLLCGFYDVTARKRHEEATARLAAIVESSDDAILSVTLDGTVQTWNRGAERLYGYAAEDIVGRSAVTLAPPDRQEEQRALFVQVRRGKTIAQKETVRLGRDGRRLTVAMTLSPMRDHSGAVVGITAVVRDITEQKRAQEAWLATKTVLERTFQNMSEVVFIVNPETRSIVMCNAAVTRMFGYTIEEVIGRNTAFLHVDLAKYEEFGQVLFPALDHGNGQCLLQFPMRRKDGASFLAEHTLSEIRDGRGRRTGVVNVIRDVTEQVRLEEQLRQAQKMEAIGRLAGGVAHDFNNLLMVINGYSALLREKLTLDSGGREALEQIGLAGSRAAQLTGQLLAFSRKQITMPHVLDLNQVVTQLEHLLRRVIGEDIELVVTPDPVPALLKADRGNLEQVLMNLAVNARDAMPGGGRLQISIANVDVPTDAQYSHGAAKPGPYIRLQVTDTGEGMTQDTLAHLFEPFFTTKPQGKGTGLGLATVYGIIQQGGGVIHVESAPQQGATFTVYWPRVQGSVTPDAEADPVQSIAARRATILLCEDNVAVRGFLASVLSKQGHRVLEAGHGLEALARAGQHAGLLDLVVTDMVMPGMNGVDLVRRLTEQYPACKAVYMSGHTDHPALTAGRLKPGQAFLQKPFQPSELFRKINEVLMAPPPP